MFPSSGFFKDIQCPFYGFGLCHRPYCHYKHVRNSRESTPTATPSSDTVPQVAQASQKRSSLTSDDVSIRDIFGSSSSDSDNDIHEPSCDAQESIDVFLADDIPLDNDNRDGEIIDKTVGDNLQLIQDKFMEVTKNETVKEAAVEEVKKEKVDLIATKKRLAHRDKVVRDHSIAVVTSKPKISTDEKLKMALNDPKALYAGKKRKAHVPIKEEQLKGTQSRPKLQTTINAKIPTKLRQQFLDSYIDEFIRMGEEPTISYSKALEKESTVFTKSSSTMIYRNHSTHELRDLRKTADQKLQERKEKSNKRVKDSLEQTTPTSIDFTSLKPSNKARKQSTNGKIKDQKQESSSSNNHKVISLKSLVKTNTKRGVATAVGVSEASERSSKSSSPLEFPESEKMIPLKFYSTKTNKSSTSEIHSNSGDLKRTQTVDSPQSDRPSKKLKMDTSFSEALRGSSDGKRKKLANPKGTIKRITPDTDSTNHTHCPSSDGRAPPTQLISCKNETKLKRPNLKEPPKPRPLPSFSILSKKEVEFNAQVFYSKLQKYLLSEEQLVDNGYPRPTQEVGMASIKRDKIIEPIPVDTLGSNAMRHFCCRCGKGFIVYNEGEYQSVEECVYHFGRLIKSKEYGEGLISKYRCCGERRESPGCQVAMMHVSPGILLPTENGYVQSLTPPTYPSYCPQVYGVDCEMVYTTLGLQLARITVVNMKMETVLESIVKPSHTIVDYNTRFSGLTARDLVDVTTSLGDLHHQLQSLVYSDTLLMGHSLESDLKSMKFIHSSVVDTALVFPHRKGLPFKRGLKELMAEQLGKFIQDNVDGGHDSQEDAKACMELMTMKVKADLQADSRRKAT